MSVIFGISGFVLLFYSLCLIIFSNFDAGIVCVMLAGVIFVVLSYFEKRTNGKSSVLNVFRNIILVIASFEIVFVSFLAIYGMSNNASYNEDAVIVLGAGVHGDKVSLPLKYRLDKAAEYFEKNTDALIVVTGGKGYQESVTEAYAMKKYLLSKGVKEDKIIAEDKATSTNENMRFSKKILDGYFDRDYSVVVITNNFHIYRAVFYAKNTGFKNVSHFYAGLKWYNILPCYMRETLAVLKMWILG